MESIDAILSSNLSKLYQIDINNNKLRSVNFGKKVSRNLKFVTLDANQLGPTLSMKMFADISSFIVDLHLSSNKIEVLKNEFQGLNFPRLTKLELAYNRLKTISNRAFKNMPNLTYLNLEYNQIEELGQLTFYSMPKLEILRLSYNNLR